MYMKSLHTAKFWVAPNCEAKEEKQNKHVAFVNGMKHACAIKTLRDKGKYQRKIQRRICENELPKKNHRFLSTKGSMK